MDVTKILEQDHRSVEALFKKIERAEGDERRPLVDELASSLRGHMELEEQVVYQAMEPVTGKETVEEGNAEHQLARKTLADVLKLAPDEPGFGAALDALEAGISHHVDEEEHEVFPKLRKEGADILDEIATPFVRRRVELGLPLDPEGLTKAATKDELVAEAEEVGVDRASSMTKSELAEELGSRMS